MATVNKTICHSIRFVLFGGPTFRFFTGEQLEADGIKEGRRTGGKVYERESNVTRRKKKKRLIGEGTGEDAGRRENKQLVALSGLRETNTQTSGTCRRRRRRSPYERKEAATVVGQPGKYSPNKQAAEENSNQTVAIVLIEGPDVYFFD